MRSAARRSSRLTLLATHPVAHSTHLCAGHVHDVDLLHIIIIQPLAILLVLAGQQHLAGRHWLSVEGSLSQLCLSQQSPRF